MDNTPRTARLSDDGKRVTLTCGKWSEMFPAAKIDDRIALYVKLRDRKDGRYAGYYADTVTQLERVKKLIAVLATEK